MTFGIFREIFPEEEGAPSMKPLPGHAPQPDEERILQYLRAGTVTWACGAVLRDAFDASKWAGPLSVITDGVWTWPSVIIYYVERYHCKVDDEFVARMRRRHWQAPPSPE